MIDLRCPVTGRMCWTWLCWRGCILRCSTLLALLILAACNGDGSQSRPPVVAQPSPTSWVVGPIINGVNYSPGVLWEDSAFRFPTAAPGVHAVTRGLTEGSRSQITMNFSIDGDGRFVEVDAGGGSPGPGKVRLFLQRCGDDWGGGAKASYRFYSQPIDLVLGASVIQAWLLPDDWTNVDGQVDADGFVAALADLCTVGAGFGGMFAMHGVYATGNAVFTMNSYLVQ